MHFKAEGENFSKILQSIKKVPNRVWIPARCFWIIPADRNSCDILLNNLYNEGIMKVFSGLIPALILKILNLIILSL